MKIFDLFTMSVRNLTRRKFRTSMTIVGVVIGTLAIIVMVSLGIGVNQSYSDFLSSWGDLTVIEVHASREQLTEAAALDILAINGVKSATPYKGLTQVGDNYYDIPIRGGKKERYAIDGWSVRGVDTASIQNLDYGLSQGVAVVPLSKKIQVLVGQKTAYQFNDTKRTWPNDRVPDYPDPVTGEVPPPFVDLMGADKLLFLTVRYGDEKEIRYELEVVGEISAPEKDWGANYGIFMDIKDVERIHTEIMKATKTKVKEYTYDALKVKVDDIKLVGVISDEIEALGFYSHSLEKDRQSAMKQTQMLQLILGSLGGISLFVAAISIANTMVMSVYERTREIGIMKVLGCFVSDIRKTFLVEACVIGFSGGVFGVLLSYLVSFVLNKYGGKIGEALGVISSGETATKISIVPTELALIGLAFATIIGIVSGLYPAYRAVKISALEAIKQE